MNISRIEVITYSVSVQPTIEEGRILHKYFSDWKTYLQTLNNEEYIPLCDLLGSIATRFEVYNYCYYTGIPIREEELMIIVSNMDKYNKVCLPSEELYSLLVKIASTLSINKKI